MKVVVSGVSGLIGSALEKHLTAHGHHVVGLTRKPSLPPLETISWDIDNGRFDASGLEGVDAIVHLAGAPVAERWNDAHKKAIRESRLGSTRLLVEALKSLERKPKLLISASAVGVYGDRGDEELDESSPPGEGFLPDTCVAWERAALDAMGLGIRAVAFRLGIVLSPRGGALRKMLLPFKLGLGGPVGTGRQWMPWIHIDDVIGALGHVIDDEALMGVVNVTSPNPVTNRAFATALGAALHRPAVVPTPRFALSLLLGEGARIVLEGQRVLPAKLQGSGFAFRHPSLAGALSDLIGPDSGG